MDLLSGNIKKLYFKYLAASFGSALITSIYGLVDMAMVGQYHGPEGAAAMAVIAPVWNIIYSLGLLTGIGGSVLFSMQRGKEQNSNKESNELFTVSVIGTAVLACVFWVILIFFEDKLLTLFGANETILPLTKQYLISVKFTVPVFLFTQVLSGFLRNDSNPGLATKAVIIGGVFNVVGDYVFVFVFDWAIMGAGLATTLGAILSVIIMLTHFKSKKNTLQLVRPTKIIKKLKRICITGFSTFFIDIGMGILTILFNRQIMKYAGTDALAVYGVIVNISTFVQCCAYGVGQAAQPIISINFGAGKTKRILQVIKYNLITVAVLSIIWAGATLSVPNAFVKLFMSASQSVLDIAPAIIRTYGISFLLLPFNIYSTYFFQSVMKPGISFVVSVSRGMLISGALILILPVVFPADSIWLAMPITELVTAVFVMWKMGSFIKTTRKTDAVVQQTS